MLGVKTIHLKNKPKRKYWLWFTLIHQAQNWQFLYSVASQHILCCDWVSWHLKLFLFILNWYHTFLLTIRIYFFLFLDLLTYHMDVNVYMCVTCYTYVCKKTSCWSLFSSHHMEPQGWTEIIGFLASAFTYCALSCSLHIFLSSVRILISLLSKISLHYWLMYFTL